MQNTQGRLHWDSPVRNRASAKPVLVPRIQSMQTYILKHHKRMILNELNRQIKNGLLKDYLKEPVTLRVANCFFADMSFWRYNTYTLLVDVEVNAFIRTAYGIELCSVYCELWADLRKGMAFAPGESGLLHEKPQREYWMLSSYLVPILRKDEIEQGAEELLLRYCPAALTDKKAHDAYALADRMGLRVEHQPLFQQSGTLSILFFSHGIVQVAEQDEEGRAKEPPRAVGIAAGTIVINTNAVHKDCCQMEIYHECIHYDWHFMFFRLQDMHHSDVRSLHTRRVVVEEKQPLSNPTKWMEWQARRGSFGLMMPQRMMEPLIDRLYAETARKDLHPGQVYDRVARLIAREYDIPKFRVRARMIQLGHIAAKGALNYVDGAYIEPFAFSIGRGGGDYSFVIDRESAFALYKSEEAFRSRMLSGRFVYVDGHICLNSAKFIQHTPMGTKLTPWANAHVDACCLRFKHTYEPCGAAEYRFGTMNSDEEYNRHYLSFAQEQVLGSEREKLLGMSRLLDALPTSFPDALTFLMKRAHMTIEDLEEKASVSNRTISRLRTEERREYSLDQIIAICIALHLPPWLSHEMIHRAGFLLRSTRQHQAYRFILDCLFMDSVEEVQTFLTNSGFQPLKLTNSEG